MLDGFVEDGGEKHDIIDAFGSLFHAIKCCTYLMVSLQAGDGCVVFVLVDDDACSWICHYWTSGVVKQRAF